MLKKLMLPIFYFLKIQELEGEIATLRSELESQGYLLEKLLNEEIEQESKPSK